MKKKQILCVILTLALVALTAMFAASCGNGATESGSGGNSGGSASGTAYEELQGPDAGNGAEKETGSVPGSEDAGDRENEPEHGNEPEKENEPEQGSVHHPISDPALETARGYPALITITGSFFNEFSDTLDVMPQDMDMPDGFEGMLGGFLNMLDAARFSVHFAPPLVVASGDSVAEAVLTMSERQIDVFGTALNGPDIVSYLMDNPDLVGTAFTITGYLDYQPPDDTVYEGIDLSMIPPGMLPEDLRPGGVGLGGLLGDLPDEYNPFLNIPGSAGGQGSYSFTIIEVSAG